MITQKVEPASPTDPVERARAIVAEEPTTPARTYKGRATKQRREIVACVMEEHIETLEVAIPVGDMRRIAHSVGRLRTLLGELKSLEGWTWEFSDGHCHLEPDPILFFIEQCRGGWRETYCMELEAADTIEDPAQRDQARAGAADRQEARLDAVKAAQPTTIAGAAALARFMVEMEELQSADAGREFLQALAAALEALAASGTRKA